MTSSFSVPSTGTRSTSRQRLRLATRMGQVKGTGRLSRVACVTFKSVKVTRPLSTLPSGGQGKGTKSHL